MFHSTLKMAIGLCVLYGIATGPVMAAITLPPVLTDHMVLQRDMPVPIWGTADPGEAITVTFQAQTKTATADAQGKWMVKLDALTATAEPNTLSISGSTTVTLKDVLVGEVWVGSGQSNLDSPVNMYAGQDSILNQAKGESHPLLRLYHSVGQKGWQAATNPELIGGYSAQLFYYGVLLQKELNVPVGVLEGAVAGSPSAPFLPQEGFKSNAAILATAAKWDQEHPIEQRQKKYEEDLAKWESAVAADMAATQPTPGASLSDQTNTTNAVASAVPTAVETAKVPPAILAKHPKPWPPGLAVDSKTGDAFEKHIRPMIPFAIRGVLWDQGEGGAGFAQLPIWQQAIMAALIPAWRQEWGEGDFPWLYVQKPSGGGCAFNPDDPVNKGAKPFEPLPKYVPDADYFSWLHREALDVVAQNTNTFLVITTDLAMGVHPTNKSGYATRDLTVALGAVYGRPIEYYGPKYDSFKIEGDHIRISYTHVGKGLVTPAGQPLQGFAVAGADKRFYWVDSAVIDGQTVVVSSTHVPNPVAVHYAWTWPLAWANLFNADGLPAIGFRTDKW